MLIFGGTINVVPWVYVRRSIPRADFKANVRARVPKSYRSRQELEELLFRCLHIGCGVSLYLNKIEHSAPTDTSADFFVVMITPVLIDGIRWRTYLIFMSLLVSPLVHYFSPVNGS